MSSTTCRRESAAGCSGEKTKMLSSNRTERDCRTARALRQKNPRLPLDLEGHKWSADEKSRPLTQLHGKRLLLNEPLVMSHETLKPRLMSTSFHPPRPCSGPLPITWKVQQKGHQPQVEAESRGGGCKQRAKHAASVLKLKPGPPNMKNFHFV